MKYFYTSHNSIQVFGQTYTNKGSLYRDTTLYLMRGKGLCVIQQRFDPDTKSFWWGHIDADLANAIFVHPDFIEFFKTHATCTDAEGGYFTINVRKLMWALRMKPLPKQYWERDI